MDARTPDPAAGGAGGQAVPVVNHCAVIPSTSHCGYLNARYEAIDRQLNGLRCRTCTVEDAGKIYAITGCSPQPGGGVCVADCSLCCYDVANSVCDSDRDCCTPLRCVPVGTGTVKACR
jgi:1,6-anhydro-N-acetylmuramate kinase